jgi:hypothetical protein
VDVALVFAIGVLIETDETEVGTGKLLVYDPTLALPIHGEGIGPRKMD